jgi:hypothetical protein
LPEEIDIATKQVPDSNLWPFDPNFEFQRYDSTKRELPARFHFG